MGTANFGWPDSPIFDISERSNWLLSTGLLINPHAYRKVKGFDNAFFVFFDDFDFTRKLLQNGFELWYFGGSRMYHKSKTTSGFFSSAWFYYSTRNILLTTTKSEKGNNIYKFFVYTVVGGKLLLSAFKSLVCLNGIYLYDTLEAVSDFNRRRFGKRSVKSIV
jgi:GT2 family glycosyltransferase